MFLFLSLSFPLLYTYTLYATAKGETYRHTR